MNKSKSVCWVELSREEVEVMIKHHDRDGLSLVGDQWKQVNSAKDKLRAALAEQEDE